MTDAAKRGRGMLADGPARIAHYRSSFEALERRLNGSTGGALHILRREAMARFERTGFPKPNDEEWRFTEIGRFLDTAYLPAETAAAAAATATEAGPGPDRYIPADPGSDRAVFINGTFSPRHSNLPSTVFAGTLAEFLDRKPEAARLFDSAPGADTHNPFAALNSAFFSGGVCLAVDDRKKTDRPLYIAWFTSAAAGPIVAHPRVFVVAGSGASVQLIEDHIGVGHGPYFTNSVTEIYAGQGSVVEYDRVQREGDHALHVSSVYMRLEAGSTVTANSVSFGSALARHNVEALLAGKNAECVLNGLTLTTGEQLIDNHTTVDHATPECASRELYKAILEERSRGVFNGKIFVRKDAQKTDAKQTNKTLLLSNGATMDTKPQLEIFADDVKCTHGATIGQLDAEQLFYLRTRGVGRDDARDILTNAFASDVLNRIRIEPLREHLQAAMHVRLCRSRIPGTAGAAATAAGPGAPATTESRA